MREEPEIYASMQSSFFFLRLESFQLNLGGFFLVVFVYSEHSTREEKHENYSSMQSSFVSFCLFNIELYRIVYCHWL